MEHGTVTRKLSSVFEELSDAFGPMYVKSDFEKLIAKLPNAKTERMGILAQLYDMLDRSGIHYEMGKGNSYYQKLVQQIKLPHLTELEDRVLRELYDRYTAWQNPQEYLERIVSRLEEPEDRREGDTLRLRILRRFIRKGNYLADMTEVKTGKNGKQTLIRKCGGQKEIEDYITKKTGIKKTDTATVLRHLDDGVFSRLEQAQERAKQTGEEKVAAAMGAFRGLCLEYWDLTVTADQTSVLMDSQKMKRVEAELARRASEEELRAFVRAWMAADEAAAGILKEKLDALYAAQKAARGKKGVDVGAGLTARRAQALEEARADLCAGVARLLGLPVTQERMELLMSKRRFAAALEEGADREEVSLEEKWETLLSQVRDASAGDTVALLVRWCGLWNAPEHQQIRQALQKAMDAVRKAREYAHEIRQTATALDGSVGLLRLVDDLAGGMFREGGATRRSLYLFATVYEMPFYTGAEGTIPTDTDLEKNLFRDYYRNNLMRYLSGTFREKLSETELDPAGMGINYKNFAEMCYLYYITRRDLTVPQRIEGAARMIQRLRESQKGAPRKPEADLGTRVFRERVFASADDRSHFVEDLLLRPEAEFEAFLRENYDCNIQRGYTMGVLDLETEQNTAFRNYQEILELLKEELREAGAEEGRELECCGYGLCFADSGAHGKGHFEEGADEGQLASFHSLLEEYNARNAADLKSGNRSLAQRLGVSEEEAAPFRELLMGVNRLLGRVVSEEVSYRSTAEERTEQSAHVIRALSVTSPRRMTRSSMITAYYYYYNAMRERSKEQEIRSFRAFYEDFTWDLDYYLTESGYLPMSSKNLFDVLVAFSAYTYYNIG